MSATLCPDPLNPLNEWAVTVVTNSNTERLQSSRITEATSQARITEATSQVFDLYSFIAQQLWELSCQIHALPSQLLEQVCQDYPSLLQCPHPGLFQRFQRCKICLYQLAVLY